MGAGLGFVRDAQNNAKRNRDNLKNKSNFTQTYKSKTPNRKLVYKESTPEELEEFRAQFLTKLRRKRIKDVMLLTSIVSVLLVVILFLF